MLLRLRQFEANYVLTGTEALARVSTARPDVVILDLHLADGDIPGFLVLKGVRARYPNLPIVAITGWYLRGEHEQEARALGVSDYLFKPVDDDTLATSLYRALESRAPAAPGRAGTQTLDAVSSADDEGSTGLRASEDAFIACWLPRLLRWTRYRWPKVWDDIILEQAEKTLIEFLGKVKRGMWPTAGALDSHLHQSIWRDVANWVQAEARRRANEARWASQLPRITRPHEPDLPNDHLRTVMALAQDDAEREALRRWIDGETSSRIAEAMGLAHLSSAGQLREVRRFKDRMTKRVRRSRQSR